MISRIELVILSLGFSLLGCKNQMRSFNQLEPEAAGLERQEERFAKFSLAFSFFLPRELRVYCIPCGDLVTQMHDMKHETNR